MAQNPRQGSAQSAKANSRIFEKITLPGSGFRQRFGLEEREPELASIDQVELEIVIKSGAILVLESDNPNPCREGTVAPNALITVLRATAP